MLCQVFRLLLVLLGAAPAAVLLRRRKRGQTGLADEPRRGATDSCMHETIDTHRMEESK